MGALARGMRLWRLVIVIAILVFFGGGRINDMLFPNEENDGDDPRIDIHEVKNSFAAHLLGVDMDEALDFKYVPGLVIEEPEYRFFTTFANATGTRPVYDWIVRPFDAPETEAERVARLKQFIDIQRAALPVPVRDDVALTGAKTADGRAEFTLTYDVTRHEVAAMSFIPLRGDLTARFCATSAMRTLYVLGVDTRINLYDRNGSFLYYFDIPWDAC